MSLRRPLAGLGLVAAMIAVAFAILFTATVINEMNTVNAANHWAAGNPDHEALSPLDYLIHAVPVFVLIGALLICFGRVRATVWVGLAVVWIAAIGWGAGFLLFAMFAEHPPDASYYAFGASVVAGLFSAALSVGTRTRRRGGSARSSPVSP